MVLGIYIRIEVITVAKLVNMLAFSSLLLPLLSTLITLIEESLIKNLECTFHYVLSLKTCK